MSLLPNFLKVLLLAHVIIWHFVFAKDENPTLTSICRHVRQEISPASGVFNPGDPTYEQDISHYYVSSSEESLCSVEPGSAEDVGKILKIVGSTRTPFAVKGGGHATNPHFSSTTGVHISMTRFSKVKYNPTKNTAEVGAGMIWDDVYKALEPYNVSLLGGRVAGIGVAGFTLGGGYSWKTNQYGLAIDSVVAYELVTPAGNILTVTESTHPDLFFGLRGGGNNFGIVTKFTFKAFPQTLIWGGLAQVSDVNIPAATRTAAKFYSQTRDPKAAILFSYAFMQGQRTVTYSLFYDAPTPPPGIFDDFLSLPTITSDIHTRTLHNFVHSATQDMAERGVYNPIPLLDVTAEILNFIANETVSVGQELIRKSSTLIAYSAEPFLSSILQHSTVPSAYPPQRSVRFLPFVVNIFWNDSAFDKDNFQAARDTVARIEAAAINMGQDVRNASFYPNYAIFDTSLEKMYGDNVRRLREIKDKIDPQKVMDLAGGFRF